ncbi:MAG: hypothetical protein ACK55Z_36125 [bacterium]
MSLGRPTRQRSSRRSPARADSTSMISTRPSISTCASSRPLSVPRLSTLHLTRSTQLFWSAMSAAV